MNTNEIIGVIAATLIVSGFIAFVWMGVKNDFRKGGDFTMKNPPGPPNREKRLEDMTYNELYEEFKQGKARLERTAELMKEMENKIDMAAGAWFTNGSYK